MHALVHSVSPSLRQASADPRLCWRLLDSQASLGQSLVGSLHLSPGSWCAQVLFVPSKSLSPQSCGSSGSSMGRVNGNLLQEDLCHTQVCCTQSPCPCGGPLLTHPSAGDTQTLKGHIWLSLCRVSCAYKVLFEPSEHLWQVWCLILSTILPLLPSCWGFSCALGCGVSFFGGIQHSPVDGCSAAS